MCSVLCTTERIMDGSLVCAVAYNQSYKRFLLVSLDSVLANSFVSFALISLLGALFHAFYLHYGKMEI